MPGERDLTTTWLALAFSLSLTLVPRAAWPQPVDLNLDPTVVAPKTRIGIGINGGGGWYNFVGAILVDDPSFEGPADANGFARAGWPWFSGGTLSASVDTNEHVSGAQSQRVQVTGAPAHMSQGRDTLPQAPLVMMAKTTETYRIRAKVKSDNAGARIRLGAVNASWGRNFGPEQAVTTSWQTYEWDYVPASDHLLRGFAIGFSDTATYWIDDFVAWNVNDIDPATGLSATFVERLRELRPASLRLGGLGVNGIPLESYLRRWWDLDYGPPALGPDLDLNTFLRLCKTVGALPFITVPPAFSDDTSWRVGDLTDNVIANVFVDHGNLVDYLGGDASTTYGARREADGFARWDLELETIYFELGNELWGTPDDKWDMDPNGGESQRVQMENYATYCDVRMTEMKSRPGWRPNMRVGFGGRSPTTWVGGWPGSYDGTLVPALTGLLDFSTIDLYYGQGSVSDSDDAIFGGLFASAVIHEREIADMKTAFRAANNGTDVETTVYEGNATWGGYESNLANPSPLYFKSVSLGAAVSLVDLYAAANRAGVTVNNHFHYGGNVWGATGPYPEVFRKPAFFALQIFTRHLAGDLVGCTVGGGGTWNDALTGEQNVPYVACYPYRAGTTWSVLLVNRHRSEPRTVRITRRLALRGRVRLTGADPNLNNETAEQVSLQSETLNGPLADETTETIPPFSAVVLVLDESAAAPADGGLGDGGNTADGGASSDSGSAPADGGPGFDGGASVDAAGRDASVDGGVAGDGCGCSIGPLSGRAPFRRRGAWAVLMLVASMAVGRSTGRARRPR